MKNANPVPRKLVSEDDYTKLLKTVSGDKFTITELAGTLGWSVPTISEMGTVLERKGLISKVFGGSKRYLVLTDAGKKAVEGGGE